MSFRSLNGRLSPLDLQDHCFDQIIMSSRYRRIVYFCWFTQFSNSINVGIVPKPRTASSHLNCKVELILGTCIVELIMMDFGIDRKNSNPFR